MDPRDHSEEVLQEKHPEAEHQLGQDRKGLLAEERPPEPQGCFASGHRPAGLAEELSVVQDRSLGARRAGEVAEIEKPEQLAVSMPIDLVTAGWGLFVVVDPIVRQQRVSVAPVAVAGRDLLFEVVGPIDPQQVRPCSVLHPIDLAACAGRSMFASFVE
jgi:hypothetical protein